MKFKLVTSLLNNITFNIKTNILIFIIFSSMVSIIVLSQNSIFSIKNDFDLLFQKRTIPLVELENIKDTLNINIYDTILEYEKKQISRKEAKEITNLAKQLIKKRWKKYKETTQTIEYKKSFITKFIGGFVEKTDEGAKVREFQKRIDKNIDKKLEIINLKLEAILDENMGDKKQLSLLLSNIHQDINSVSIYITTLINKNLKLAIEDKTFTDKVFSIMVILSFISIAIVFIFSIVLSWLIIDNFKDLNTWLENKVQDKTKELKDLNDSLKRRVELEVGNNRKKDRIMFQQARLASLGEMLENIAHQWRQPLGALMTILQGFQTKKMLGKLTDEYLDEKLEDAMRLSTNMTNTIEDFKNFFAPNKLKTHFFLKECITHSITLSKYLLDKDNIKVNLQMKDDIMIFGFYNELSHVILNIISNSKDALVRTRGVDERFLEIIVNGYRDKVQLHIIDNGGGIDRETLPKIFEPYFTTKHKSAGTGIGLYMSKEMVEKHMNGTIICKNIKYGSDSDGNYYESTMFSVTIPILKEETDGK